MLDVVSSRAARLVVFVLGVSLVSSVACLSGLPEATVCAGATQEFCNVRPPPGSAPGDGGMMMVEGGGGCLLVGEPCMGTRGTCACTKDNGCTRGASTCFPPPNCPGSVRQAKATAECIEPRLILRPENLQPPCLCGCSSCAETCDGKGPIFGPNQTFAIELPATLGERGSLGAMIRGRGTGAVMVAIAQGPPGEAGTGMTPTPFGNLVFQGDQLDDLFASTRDGITYDWTESGKRPTTLQVTTDANSYVEIDCVVPFLVP